MQIGRLRQEDRDGEDLALLTVHARAVRGRGTEEEARLRALRSMEEALEGFDLSANEARVYLLLARSGARKAQRVAESLGIHRTEAYKVLRRLEARGLVSCVLERPMRFVALPLEGALDGLIGERRHLVRQLERRKGELLDLSLSMPMGEEEAPPRETFGVLEGRRQIGVRANRLLEGCQGELLIALPDSDLLWLYNTPFFDGLGKAVRRRRLDLRLLTNFSPTSSYVLERVDLGGDVAFVQEAPGFMLADGARMLLMMGGNGKPSAIFTSCGSMVMAFRTLFTLLWERVGSSPVLRLAGVDAKA